MYLVECWVIRVKLETEEKVHVLRPCDIKDKIATFLTLADNSVSDRNIKLL